MDFCIDLMKALKLLLSGVVAPLLAACEDGRITLSVTDAPVDFAEEVVVQFRAVAFERDDGTREVIEFDTPQRIDLARLTGEFSEALVEDQPLPASSYRAIEFSIDGSQTGLNSYVQLTNGAQLPLYVPEAFEDELRVLADFTIEEEGSVAATVDFDLRRSLFIVDDAWVELRPQLRFILDEDAGSVTGAVADSLLQQAFCTPAVYVYEGTDVEPDDVGGSNDEPISSAIVTSDADSGARRYAIGFLAPGSYTLALTCDAGNDEPDQDDDITFIRESEIGVRAGRRGTLDFQ